MRHAAKAIQKGTYDTTILCIMFKYAAQYNVHCTTGIHYPHIVSSASFQEFIATRCKYSNTERECDDRIRAYPRITLCGALWWGLTQPQWMVECTYRAIDCHTHHITHTHLLFLLLVVLTARHHGNILRCQLLQKVNRKWWPIPYYR